MINKNLETALTDLVDGIRGACLGSVEWTVIVAAGKELIVNWNDHNADDQIDTDAELAEFEEEIEES